ncbi:MAG TPA: hypothetical protein VFW33_21580, partial [Gemmataceae bacterium]|nr:hypothetical protein [Gemmataceae bacterium]
SSGAAVPAALTAAAVRAALSANGAVPAAVAQLTRGLVRNTTLARLKTTIVLLLGTAVIGLGAVPLASPKGTGTPQAAAKEPSPPAERPAPAEKPAPAPAETKEMTVTGRVVGPDGKAVGGAHLAVVAWEGAYASSFESPAWERHSTLGRTKADADGRFRLTFTQSAAPPEPRLRLLAGATGLGIAWTRLDAKAESVEADIHLPPEQVVRGRVVDLQGEPVAGARILLTELKHHPAKGEKDQGTWDPPPGALPFGPVTATADPKGNFTVRGLGNNLTAEFEVHDDRVELNTFTVETADKKRSENVKLALPPGRVVEGRVTYADTGKPAAGARVLIITAGGGDVRGNTDKDGRYRLNVRPRTAMTPASGEDLGVHVYPPDGEPYWMAFQGVGGVKGATHHEANVALPRGVLLRGKITEAGTGRPVAGAYIEYNGEWMSKGRSGADGSYAFAVPAGATGPLTVNAPTSDYVAQVVGSARILAGQEGGDRIYYHAVVPLGLKPGDKEKELPIVLRRGVTVKGSVVGADGKAVKDAILFVGEYKPPREKFLYPIRVSEGRFELPGCDPDRTYHLVFAGHPWMGGPMGVEALNTFGQLWLSGLLGPGVKSGAVVDVPAKQAAAEPIEVRLAACGSAKLRFVGADGKPLAKHKPWVQLVVTGGPPANEAIKDGKLCAEVVTLISQYLDEAEPHADADGVLKLEGLIPGATYRVKQARFEGEVLKEFTVESGKTLELTVTVK